MTHLLPRVILHNAVSLDGRVDWITPDVGLFYRLAAVWQEDCTLAGSDTILRAQQSVPAEDDQTFQPAENAAGDTRPLLAIVDSRGRVRTWHYWRKQPQWRDAVALCTARTPAAYLDYLRERRIETIVAGDYHVDLRAALEELNARFGVKTVRADSGGALNGALLRAGLVDEVSLLVHPALVGGTSPRSFFRADDLVTPEGVIHLHLTHFEPLPEGIVWLRYEVSR